jgi:hypothetical protein
MSNNSSIIKMVNLPVNLQKTQIINTIKQDIISTIQKITNIVQSPNSLELLHYIALLIESIVDKNLQIDKMTLLKDILKILFPNISDEELIFAENAVEYMLSEKLIKGVPILKKALTYAYEILKKLIAKS